MIFDSSITQNPITMKALALTFAIIMTSLLSFSQEETIQKEPNQTITVIIDNVKNDTGNVIISLHNESTFLNIEGIESIESKIKNGKVKVTFKAVSSGTYAILAMHDENENKVMDFDSNRMPIESYGMSNNPLIYGPPQFIDAKFELTTKDLEFIIRF